MREGRKRKRPISMEKPVQVVLSVWSIVQWIA